MFARLTLASTTILGLIGAASAADLPRRAAPPPIFTPVPVFTWSGFYIGGNAGYAWTDDRGVRTIPNDTVTARQLTSGTVAPTYRLRQDGFTGGGQIGYNYQFTPGSGIVVGVEADAAYTDLKRTSTFAGTFGVTSQYNQQLDYLGTVRGRIGYAFDRVLVYGTGGFAYGQTEFSQAILANNAARSVIWSGGRKGMQTGYAYGGGIEYALPTDSFLNFFRSSAVTVKVEYLRYDLGTKSALLVGGLGRPYSFTDRIRTEGNLVRAGLNYKFGTF
jgi:outer membrane immunogenic protein